MLPFTRGGAPHAKLKHKAILFKGQWLFYRLPLLLFHSIFGRACYADGSYHLSRNHELPREPYVKKL